MTTAKRRIGNKKSVTPNASIWIFTSKTSRLTRSKLREIR